MIPRGLSLLLALCFAAPIPCLASDGQAGPYTIDDFEKEQSWEVKEWGDGAKLELTNDLASQGQSSLRVSFTAKESRGQKKIALRRELSGKASVIQSLTLDLFNPLPPEGVELAIAVEADQYYETKPLPLKQGWNRNLRFAIDDAQLKSKSSDWEYKTKIPDDAAVGSLILLVQKGEANAGSFIIDNIRSAGKPRVKERIVPRPASITLAPRWKDVRTILAPQGVYGLLELGLDFEASYHDPYSGQEILVVATFSAPSGASYKVEGFLYKGKVTLGSPPEAAEWRLRFSPPEKGLWSYQIALTNPKGTALSPKRTFTVAAEPVSDGFLRVDPKDPLYFSFDSGRFFYPLGHNAAWWGQDDYRKLFPTMKANGENWTRLWMSHWSFGIEWKPMGTYHGLGNYNLENAARLDEILRLMEQNGVYAQLVFEYHGALSSQVNAEWANNPYNSAQNGPLKKAQDFFTDLKAREIYKRRLRYIVARWGYSPQIMAWELFNEISFADDFNFENDYAWHKDISKWLKDLDPYKHMITTSYYDSYNKKTFALPTIDYSQYHAYHHDVWKTMANVVPRLQKLEKPYFFGEFGGDSADGVDAKDKQGVFIHAGIWTQAMQVASGNAMPWWWDTLIQPNQLYRHFGALARFLEGIDRRGRTWSAREEKWPVKMKKSRDETLIFNGLQSRDLILGWICDEKGMRHLDRASPQQFRGIEFYLTPEQPGRFLVQYWNTENGTIIGKEEETTDKSGRLLLSLPPFRNDVAFRASRF